MWIPTHVKVTVHKARNLKVEGRSGANDSYVVIHLDDTNFTTSVKTRSKAPEWNENCDMPIPSDMQNSVVNLTVHHRNLFTSDDFLGEANISLKQCSVYERPQSRWYSLVRRRSSKQAGDDLEDGTNALGEVLVTVTFMVQSQTTVTDQLGGNFARQRSLSLRSLASQVGMKLIGRWSSQTDLKDASLTELTGRKCPVHSMLEFQSVSCSFHHLQLSPTEDDVFACHRRHRRMAQSEWEPAPNHTQEEMSSSKDDRRITEKSIADRKAMSGLQKEADSSGGYEECGPDILRRRPVRPLSLHTLTEESQESQRSVTMECVNNAKNVYASPIQSCRTPVYADDYIRSAQKRHSYVGCGETPPMVAAYRLNQIEDFMENEKRLRQSAIPPENILDETEVDHFEGYDRDDLIKLVLEQQTWIKLKRAYVQDLEEYIDGLLIRVLDTNHQTLLENPYNKRGNKSKQLQMTDKNQKNTTDKMTVKRLIALLQIWK